MPLQLDEERVAADNASRLEWLDEDYEQLARRLAANDDSIEAALGDAYTEPAADVRGYVAQAMGQAVAG